MLGGAARADPARWSSSRCRCWWRCAASAWAAGWKSRWPASLIFAAPRRAARPARDQARRVRAGRLLPAAASASARPRPRTCCCPAAASAPSEALAHRPGAGRWPTIRRPPRSPISTSTWRRKSASCAAPAPSAAARARLRRATCAQRSGRSRAALSRRPDGNPRRERRPRRLHRQAARRNGSTADERTPATAAASSRAARRCSRTCTSTPSSEWKAAVPGRKAIGYMPVYVPRELIHAAGMLPVGILGGGDQLEVIQGDAYYQSYICRIPRSTIELGLTGRLDCLDGMLFPSICDVIRNLSGMWKMLFKDKYVALLRRAAELPGRRSAATSTSHEMQVLREDLGELARQADHRRRRCDASIARLQREPRARCASSTPTARPSPGRRRPPRSICCCAPAWCCRSRSTRSWCASTSPRPTPRRGRSATTPASC